jgi:hypothetical protein
MAGDGRVAGGGSVVGTGSDPNDPDGQFDSQNMPTTDGQMASGTSEEVRPPRADSPRTEPSDGRPSDQEPSTESNSNEVSRGGSDA